MRSVQFRVDVLSMAPDIFARLEVASQRP